MRSEGHEDPTTTGKVRNVTSQPLIVGIGGTVRPNSSSEQALTLSLACAEAVGARTVAYGGDQLADLPIYAPGVSERHDVARSLIRDIRRADGVIISSPAYHGSVSGMVKNALDYVEDLRDDDRPYLSERGVGLIVTAYGWQAAVTTLSALRSIGHALRGWVTPYGATINSMEVSFADGACDDERTLEQLGLVAEEVLTLAESRAALAGGIEDLVSTAPGS